MRLVQLVSDTDRRGAQVFATLLEEALRERGNEVRTVALTQGSAASPLDLAILTSSRWWIAGLPALRRQAATADLVIAHGSTTLPACALALGSDTPFVYRSIGDIRQWVGHGLRRRRVVAMLGRAAGVSVLWSDLVPFVTQDLGVEGARVQVLPNAVVADRFPAMDGAARSRARTELGVDADRPMVGYVGSLSEEKQVRWLIEASARLGLGLVVAGDGPERAGLAAEARRHGVDAVFLGPVVDPSPVYAAADVVALASRTEGQPAVLMEAALCGRPVVAPRVGGIVEVVADGHTGVLFDIDGGVGALTLALEAGLADAANLGSAGREWVLERFDLELVADRWQAWLERF